MKRYLTVVAALFIAAALAGCGDSGPSERDMVEGLKQYRVVTGMLVNIARRKQVHLSRDDASAFGQSVFDDTAIIETTSCTELKSTKGYACTFRIGKTNQDGSVDFSPEVSGHFFQSDQGWTFKPSG